jgi:hypothetical protein
MLKKLSQGTGATMHTSFIIKLIALTVLVAAMSSISFAQTQSNTGAAIAALVTDAKATPAVSAPAPESPISPVNTSVKPKAQGAGSDNQGYLFIRGYAFHIHRSKGDPAVINSDALGNIQSVNNFNYGTEGAFKIEAGWNATNNWGFRASYFYTNQTAQENRTGGTAAPFIISPRPLNVTFTGAAANGTAATFREKLRLHVIDLEGTYKWHSTNSSVLVSAGVRIAPSRQTYTAQDVFVTTPENLSYTQKRTGVGPTVAIDLRHRLGGSDFWITGAGRFAALFGQIKESATFASGTFSQTNTRNQGRTNGVWEGEVGLEWAHKFGSGNEFFLNGSFVTHDWVNLVNVIPTSAVGGSATTSLDNPTAAATRKGSVLFVGGSFSLGFRF